jgi:hypothetical protein
MILMSVSINQIKFCFLKKKKPVEPITNPSLCPPATRLRTSRLP